MCRGHRLLPAFRPGGAAAATRSWQSASRSPHHESLRFIISPRVRSLPTPSGPSAQCVQLSAHELSMKPGLASHSPLAAHEAHSTWASLQPSAFGCSEAKAAGYVQALMYSCTADG